MLERANCHQFTPEKRHGLPVNILFLQFYHLAEARQLLQVGGLFVADDHPDAACVGANPLPVEVCDILCADGRQQLIRCR